MIHAVAFDLGKVLVDFDYRIAARKIAGRTRMLADELMFFMMQSPLLPQFETGLITSQQFYREIRAATGFCGDFEEFSGLFGDIFIPIQPMIDLHSVLRRKGVPTYIFSNTNDLAVHHIRRVFPFFADFDGYILSYEHRAMKPDPRLYEVVEEQSGQHGPEILYLDDRPENVAAGAARGWQTILHQSPEKSRTAVEKLGLLNDAKTLTPRP
jgi:HAD superfamily hydrolase (TIGR01509 family)